MKKEREISYNEIKDGEFFYMPVDVYGFKYILPNVDSEKNKIGFISWYKSYREFTDLLLSYNTSVKKAYNNTHNRMFLFQKIKGQFIIEPNTNSIFTLEGDILNTVNYLDLSNKIPYNEAKDYIDFFENNPVAIQCYSDQKFYLPNENIVIEQSEELEKAIEYIVATAKDISKEEYEKLKDNKEQKAKRYIRFIQNNI